MDEDIKVQRFNMIYRASSTSSQSLQHWNLNLFLLVFHHLAISCAFQSLIFPLIFINSNLNSFNFILLFLYSPPLLFQWGWWCSENSSISNGNDSISTLWLGVYFGSQDVNMGIVTCAPLLRQRLGGRGMEWEPQMNISLLEGLCHYHFQNESWELKEGFLGRKRIRSQNLLVSISGYTSLCIGYRGNTFIGQHFRIHMSVCIGYRGNKINNLEVSKKVR